jgi:hypothetical protein
MVGYFYCLFELVFIGYLMNLMSMLIERVFET